MIDEFAYLWESPRGRYYLVEPAGVGLHRMIWDSKYGTALIIEEHDTYHAVLARMAEAGVPVVARIADVPSSE